MSDQDLQPVDARVERRSKQRRPYPVKQLVAFHEESEVPTQEMFQEVLCRDLSTWGISFYFAGPPSASHCTIALGRASRLLYVAAKVIHYEPYAGPNHEWVIGCQFLNRVSL
jgi:hypothetical protein